MVLRNTDILPVGSHRAIYNKVGKSVCKCVRDGMKKYYGYV